MRAISSTSESVATRSMTGTSVRPAKPAARQRRGIERRLKSIALSLVGLKHDRLPQEVAELRRERPADSHHEGRLLALDVREEPLNELARRAARAGVTWHLARPPVVELEYEMDCRSVAVERVI